MRILARYALSIAAGAALLAGCGGSQATIAEPDAMPKTLTGGGPADAPGYKIIVSFPVTPNGGSLPYAPVVSVGDKLYGTTSQGGTPNKCGIPSSYSCGTVFSVTKSGTAKMLHNFGAANDGSNPLAGLIDVDGTLYGTTYSSFPSPAGAVFSITPSGREKVLYFFKGNPDGCCPTASLIDVDGTLYGTTFYGGAYATGKGLNSGTVFSITPAGVETVLHSFGNGTDGSNPGASLVELKGTLYGTTAHGGAHGFGTVFSITTQGTEKVLHSFGKAPDGRTPLGALTNVRGVLYGTTANGGAYSSLLCGSDVHCGTIFSITPGGRERVLHSFAGAVDGAHPAASLIAVKGTLYGTATGGGTRCGLIYYDGACGTVFSATTTGTVTVLHNFGRGHDGAAPMAGLTDVGGSLYGTTRFGGARGFGTVFTLKP